MKATKSRSRRPPEPQSSPDAATGKIHPVVIFPFNPADEESDLPALYQLVERLDGDRDRYRRAITVIDRKTHFARVQKGRYREFREKVVGIHSDILDGWYADTCQMWYAGLGQAWERGAPGDVYWLIPGDFNYGSPCGHEVLSRLHDLPEIVLELHQDLCVGEIETDHSNSKQLIDTYGTFALLYNWFPAEAQEIRQYTERPRSEFFAIRHEFLGQMLRQRWFAYEETVVLLLNAVFSKKQISRFRVGEITDLVEGRESVASALQQVERTERVLKTVWRERNQSRPDWIEQYHALEGRSEQIRRTAMTILERLLR
jgi:hypothetical protein